MEFSTCAKACDTVLNEKGMVDPTRKVRLAKKKRDKFILSVMFNLMHIPLPLKKTIGLGNVNKALGTLTLLL